MRDDFNNATMKRSYLVAQIAPGQVSHFTLARGDQLNNTWRTYAVTIPLTDLVAGTNVVQLGANTDQLFTNVNIVLVDVPGGVPVLPGSNNTYPVN
jgi:hypothetical protein